MTVSLLEFTPPPASRSLAIRPPRSSRDITVVVPARDAQEGVNRLLDSFAALPEPSRPAEVLVIDNLSSPALKLEPTALPAQLLQCDVPGPAAARNVGWRQARTPWILFLDADCIPTEELIPGFLRSLNGAIAYAGDVQALTSGAIPGYYDSQKTLVPPPRGDRPAYLVTANTLAYRPGLEAIGGFDETFNIAGGEDIDLALRIRSYGELSYAPGAVALHDFEPSLRSFWSRFVRYGKGNRILEERHDVCLGLRPFVPAQRSPVHFALSFLQFLAMGWGYLWSSVHALRRPRPTSGRVSAPLPS